jgi:hypothetical protein
VSYYKKSGLRDPSSHRTPEQIRAMDRGYNHQPGNVKKRTERNQARAMLAKEGLVHKGDGRDVDHKKMVKDGGTNNRKNLRVLAASANRGWADGKV